MQVRTNISFSGFMRRFKENYIHYICLFAAQQIIYLRLSFSPLSNGYLLKWDFVDFHYLFNLFNSDAYRSGEIPLWNPYNYCGIPFAANPQCSVFYPLSWLHLLMPVIHAQKYMIVLHVLLGGGFMYLFLRRTGRSQSGAIAGSEDSATRSTDSGVVSPVVT